MDPRPFLQGNNMASNKDELKQFIIEELKAVGFVTEGEFAMAEKLAIAIANATVRERVKNATVTITSGSSAGIYKVD